MNRKNSRGSGKKQMTIEGIDELGALCEELKQEEMEPQL